MARSSALTQRPRRTARTQPLVFGMTQPALITTSEPDRTYQQFLAFLHKHPEVYAAFCRHAERLYQKGIRHYGANALVEVVRYETTVSAASATEPFKINNNYAPHMARLLAAQQPRFAEFFEFRRLRAG